jgi:hypothetical protein
LTMLRASIGLRSCCEHLEKWTHRKWQNGRQWSFYLLSPAHLVFHSCLENGSLVTCI